MRRWTLWVLIGLLGGCAVPGSDGDAADGEGPVPPGQGQLEVRWTGERPGRAVMGSPWASSVADLYELVLLGPRGDRSVVLTSGSGQVIAVDPGTYHVLVLAGVKRSAGSSTVLFVGSALAEGVTVPEGSRTLVDLTLRSADWELGLSGKAYWQGPLTVTTSGKTRNPRVGMLLSGTSTAARPRFRSSELWNGYKEMAVVSGTPDAWSAEVTAKVPDGIPLVTVGLVGAGLCVLVASGEWVPTAGLTRNTWIWPNRTELAENHPLVPFTETAVPCFPPPTGVGLNLAWE